MASRTYTLHRAWAKQATIGFLGATTPKIWGSFVKAFEQGLRDKGWIDGYNIAIEYRWAEGREDLYAKFAEEFVDLDVDVIVTSGTNAFLAAKKATKRIPIVFAAAGDPVKTKLVKSLKHPGGNVTGLSNRATTDLAGQRIDQLLGAVPEMQRMAIVGHRRNRVIPLEMKKVAKGARARGIEAVIRDVKQVKDIAPTIKGLKGKAAKDKVDALFVCSDPFITTHQHIIHTAAAAANLPTMHAFSDYVDAGGFMSFGPDFHAMFAKAGSIVDQILRGKKPSDIPVKLQKGQHLALSPHLAHTLGVRIPKRARRRASLRH
jgi:putative ABC transport system substrate-binding protein